jgi:SPP1 family predicted phage head-tail adaptor
MRIGRLDKLIRIERPIITGISGANEPVRSWDEYRRCWAEAYDVRSREAFDEEIKQRLAETTTRFRIHYRDAAGIDATMRVRYQNRLYDIKSVVVDHVRKQSATIDAVAQSVTVAGARLELLMEADATAIVGQVYQAVLHIFGGIAPYTVALTDGSPAFVLPPGLNLVQASETSWSLEGFPAEAGSWPISITVTDAASNVAVLEPFVLTITSDGSP